MDNKVRVKHFNSRIYNPIKRKIVKIALAAAAVGLLFAAGWMLYEPLMDEILLKNKEINSKVEVEKTEKIDVAQQDEIAFLERDINAVIVPSDIFCDDELFSQYLSDLDKDVTAVIVDLKTQDGKVTYKSEQKSVISAGAMAENAVDISKRIEEIREKDLIPAARIYAFEDHTAPYNSEDLAIKYMDSQGVLWLDDSFDNGGKAWMNPYSETAQKYILDIVYDALDENFDAIIVDGVRFPQSAGLQYAYYGGNAETISKSDILIRFMERLYASTAGYITDIIFAYDEYLSLTSDVYANNTDDFICDGKSPYIKVSDFIGTRINGFSYYRSFPGNVTKIFREITDICKLDTESVPVIDLEGLSVDNLKEIKEVLKEKGISRYVLKYSDSFGTEEVLPNETESAPNPYMYPVSTVNQ